MRWKSNQIQYFRNLTGCVPGAKRGGEERAGGEKSPSPLSSIPSRFSFVYFPFRNLGEQAQWPEIRRYFIYLFLLLLCFFGSRGKKRKTDYTDKGRGHDRRLAQWPQSTRLLPMWSMWCHVWIEFVIGSFLYSERFFSSPQKSTFPNSNSIWNARTHLNVFLRTLKFLVGK